MISIIYLVVFAVSLHLVIHDKDFEIIQQPCLVCMPKILIILSLACLFLGAEVFTLFAPRNVWVISGVMTLSISGFMLGVFFVWERNKQILSLLQMIYVLVITVDFYSWWYI